MRSIECVCVRAYEFMFEAIIDRRSKNARQTQTQRQGERESVRNNGRRNKAFRLYCISLTLCRLPFYSVSKTDVRCGPQYNVF